MAKLPGAIAGARIVGEKFVHAQRQQNPEGRMPLMDHIRELRNRVVKIALALGAGDPARRRELDPGRSVHELRDGHAAGLRAGL